MGNTVKNLLIWVAAVVIIVSVFNSIQSRKELKTQINYSTFVQEINESKVKEVDIQGSLLNGLVIKGKRNDGSEFSANAQFDFNLINSLIAHQVEVKVTPEEKPGILMNLLISSIPILLLVGLWFYFMKQMQGGGAGGKGGAFSFGKSRAKLLDKSANNIRFKDVAGVDEAKEEVQEVVDFLKSPQRYQNLGGKIPGGVLLVGSPGTGKTLLAKAIAGEATVPFYSISGSDFLEMFVGVGASRVRDMFEQAKKTSPCIIFIDEIDAVGRQRGAGLGGGNDEREQTLNQLLVEMDGMDTNSTVIVIAATNRPDVLDPALLRPGRFDRQVTVPLPDIKGREQILNVHMNRIKVNDSIDLKNIARGTPGFSGADLANLVNEAALLAGRKRKNKVDQGDFEEAKDKIYMGPERKSMVMHEDDKKATAYHESGHAIVAASLPGTDPVHKVTIVPRGRALGLTWQLPERDKYSKYKDQLLNEISILFGGRIAEDLFVQRISTGASNDFERATQIAKDMVMRYGMSDKMGPVVYAENQDEIFLGRSVAKTQHVSEATMKQVDKEIRRIIDEQYAVSQDILEKNRDKVEVMTEALMKWETIDKEQIQEIMAGKTPSEPKGYDNQNAENQEIDASSDKSIEEEKSVEEKKSTEENNHSE